MPARITGKNWRALGNGRQHEPQGQLCYDNATMESFWSTLKHELIYRCGYQTRTQAQQSIFEWIEVFYNRTRLHSSLGFKSPVDFENQLN